MFKILALAGAIAGGVTYGLYAHTNLLDGTCGGGCPLAALSSCCSNESAVTPSCCLSASADSDNAHDGSSACPVGATAVGVASVKKPGCCEQAVACCAEKTAAVSAKKTACCDDSCSQCVIDCSVCCPACPVVCGDCCGVSSAKSAVAGPAAIVTGALKK